MLIMLSVAEFLKLGNIDRFSYRRAAHGEDGPVH